MTSAYFHNNRPVSAEAFYAIACDPRRSVAVEACAGAGKTWMLVSRILRALLEGDGQVQPHEILAITFTKKAAGEMRERLYEWLEKFAHADDETLRQELVVRGVLSQKSPQSPVHMRELLSNLYQRVLANGRPVQIRTFHSWFAALLRSAPLATLQHLGLPVNYQLLEDDAPARASVWRRFYAAVAADAALKADFEAVVLVHGRFQADKALQGALDKRIEFMLADAAGVIDRSVRHFSAQFAECSGLDHPDDHLKSNAPCRELMAAAAISLGRAGAATFSAKGVELAQAIADNDTLSALSALLTKEGTARKFGEKIVGIAGVREAQEMALLLSTARQQHEAWDYQQRMARLTRTLLTEFTALKRERGWVDMNDVERAAQVMLTDPVLSGWVQERLDARIRHLLIDEFQDTNPLQWQALYAWLSGYGGAGNAPSVFIVGDPKQSIYRFRRAEPQVFSAAKRFIVEGLGGELLECDHTRRNSLEVTATVNAAMAQARDNDGFDGFREHTTASAAPGSVVRLPQIARSANKNDSATAGMLESGWRDSLTTPRELPEETLRTLEARQAAAWIAEQLRIAGERCDGPSTTSSAPSSDERGSEPRAAGSVGAERRDGPPLASSAPSGGSALHEVKSVGASQFMVLSRRRAGLMPLLDELRALHIPAQIGENTELIDCCEVLDIVALLDVLVSPQHDLSMARALRSPLFNIGNEALVQIVLAKGSSNRSWFDLLQNQELVAPEYIGLAATLTRYKGWVDSLPPHDALQAIYQHGDVLARFAAAAPATSRSTVLANLRALLGVALQLDGGRYATPYAFVRALKAGGLQALAAVNPGAVRLLTVHGAKGLEADFVLLLDTDTAERNADSMSVLVDWPGEAAAPRKFVFLVSESRPPACSQETLLAEQAARQREELNALYVALTRARNTLVLSSTEPHRSAPQSWWQRLHSLADETAAPGPAAVPGTLDGDPLVFYLPDLPDLPDLPAIGPGPGPQGGVAAIAEEDSVSARVGKAVHRLLERGAALLVLEAGATGAGAGPATGLPAAVAREFKLSADQLDKAVAMARRIRNGDAAWCWDPAVVGWQGNEVELIHSGQILRLDRLVRRKDAAHAGHWWVLDFKSASEPLRQPLLVAQLQDYRSAVQQIYPGETVRAAFLTGQGAMVPVP
jgi:ATP-dependent helicase/nuclease subunit A